MARRDMAQSDNTRQDVAGATTYRRLLRLYPRALRDGYGEEMVLLFTELRRRHGRRAWGRLLLDLAVSVPRTRLESVMSTAPSTRAVVTVEVAAAALISALAFFALGPAALPVPLFLTGLLLVQRSRLARSLEGATEPSAVRPAVTGLVASEAVLAGAIGSWAYHVRAYDDLSSTSVVLHNVVAVLALASTLAFAALAAVRLHRRPPGIIS